MSVQAGAFFHGEFSSADASAPANEAAARMTLYGAGETISKGDYAANGSVSWPGGGTPHYCKAGTYPKVRTSGAGQVYVQVRGFVQRIDG